MAGLRKHKKYNWKETNLSFFGSDLEKEVSILYKNVSMVKLAVLL